MELGFRLLLVLAIGVLLACGGGIAPASAAGGRWELLQDSVGVSAMHMQLLHNDRVILFDRTNFGPSNLTFPPATPAADQWFRGEADCTAHSVEYDVASNTFRALSIFTDTWCSSGYVAPDGTLVQTGGSDDGIRKVRLMPACTGGADDTACDWSEKPTDPDVLAADRWYATNQKLPDGSAIIVGGRGQPNYEFYPKADPASGTTLPLQFLSGDNSMYLYPFVHLNVDGNLFIFENNRAILFDYNSGSVVRTYPTLGDGAPRNNPTAGSSVLLPLKPNATEAEVLICGGAPASSISAVNDNGQFPPALRTCGRIKITDPEPAAAWVLEDMPSPRVMGDMILLPNGEVLIINGATDGIAGWDSANTFNPTPVVYRPDRPLGDRFEAQAPAAGTPRPRMYHASAVLLRDGRVLLGGSNPHERYVFGNAKFPTELSLEAFSPDYLDASNDDRRPSIVNPSLTSAPVSVKYDDQLVVAFRVPVRDPVVSVTMVAPSFTTHSFAQNQRLLFLQAQLVTKAPQLPGIGGAILPTDVHVASVTMPTKVLAPPGYYLLFVVNGRIPSKGIWVHIQ
ncbi:hypothetical protein PAHAL_7G206500 [Panicum hallii]|uniref:Galactose oxidase-like Early set domain-containing protein n=1 Tax=Panicum hallii TaxID=206008 RepID=A0A2S3I814_9POAL|nr:hypothetical protein PAHAL_7G206500 [Panicum hallii]